MIKTSFYLLFFLVPLILTPFNYELFEFNKMLIVYLLTTIIVVSWLIKMVANKKIICRRTFLDIPLCLFLFSQILATIFSIDRHTSWWGYYSRFNGGLLSTISYFLLYYAFVSNMSRAAIRRALRIALISAGLVASYGIAEHFGIDAQYWVQDVKNRVFSTLGQPNWLAAYLVALMPLTWAFTLNSKKLLNIKYYILNIIFYICLLFTKSRSGILGFGAAFLVFWSASWRINRHQWRRNLKPFIIFTFSFLILSLIIGTPVTPNLKTLTTKKQFVDQPPPAPVPSPILISESGDIRKVVWRGAIEIWKHYPIFGTGTETFAYSYYWYRPREHNDLSEWDFLYNKAHNEYLNYAATTGSVGFGSYLLLIGWFSAVTLKNLLASKTKNPLLISSLLAGYTSILVTNFFGFSVVSLSLLFFLILAMVVCLTQKKLAITNRATKKISSGQGLLILIILIFGLYFLYSIFGCWYADYQFAQAEKLNKNEEYDLAFNSLQLAIRARPQEPIYRDELAWVAANLAVSTHQQKNATLSAQLVEVAISESDKALKISPYHLNFWKNRTKMFHQLSKIDEEYYQEALASLLQATELAPTDPKIKYNLALFFASNNQIDTAIKALEEAVVLKPNYENAHYALALFYEQQGEKNKAKEHLEYILEKINPNSQPAIEKLKGL